MASQQEILAALARQAAAQQEAARVEAARVEVARLETARVEAARVEVARLETARVEAARVEVARLETARVEATRVEATRVEAERQAEEIKQRKETYQLSDTTFVDISKGSGNIAGTIIGAGVGAFAGPVGSGFGAAIGGIAGSYLQEPIVGKVSPLSKGFENSALMGAVSSLVPASISDYNIFKYFTTAGALPVTNYKAFVGSSTILTTTAIVTGAATAVIADKYDVEIGTAIGSTVGTVIGAATPLGSFIGSGLGALAGAGIEYAIDNKYIEASEATAIAAFTALGGSIASVPGALAGATIGYLGGNKIENFYNVYQYKVQQIVDTAKDYAAGAVATGLGVTGVVAKAIEYTSYIPSVKAFINTASPYLFKAVVPFAIAQTAHSLDLTTGAGIGAGVGATIGGLLAGLPGIYAGSNIGSIVGGGAEYGYKYATTNYPQQTQNFTDTAKMYWEGTTAAGFAGMYGIGQILLKSAFPAVAAKAQDLANFSLMSTFLSAEAQVADYLDVEYGATAGAALGGTIGGVATFSVPGAALGAAIGSAVGGGTEYGYKYATTTYPQQTQNVIDTVKTYSKTALGFGAGALSFIAHGLGYSTATTALAIGAMALVGAEIADQFDTEHGSAAGALIGLGVGALKGGIGSIPGGIVGAAVGGFIDYAIDNYGTAIYNSTASTFESLISYTGGNSSDSSTI